jgi:glycosyltransferase involved in cell wall biosynthesis
MVNIMKVSIIIPIYNGSLLLNRCLNSVFGQNGNFELEVIVIDDGSTDNSIEFARNYPNKVKLIQQKNQGPAAARNKGIEVATGIYITFLDADDYWEVDFLESTVCFMKTHPEAVAVSVGQLHKIPGKPDSIAPGDLRFNPDKFTEPILLTDFFEFWAEHNHVCTGSVLMKTNIVKQTGGQREELHLTEDHEFWAYLSTFGQWGFIPKVLFVSDGGIITQQTGWLKKNKKRWASAPNINIWEKRIIQRFSGQLTEGYLFARGRIAGILAYAMILSSNDEIARQTIIEHKLYLPKNRITLLLKTTSISAFLWYFVCIFLRFRETKRKI